MRLAKRLNAPARSTQQSNHPPTRRRDSLEYSRNPETRAQVATPPLAA